LLLSEYDFLIWFELREFVCERIKGVGKFDVRSSKFEVRCLGGTSYMMQVTGCKLGCKLQVASYRLQVVHASRFSRSFKAVSLFHFENIEGITDFSSRAQIPPFGGVRESLAFDRRRQPRSEHQTLEPGGGCLRLQHELKNVTKFGLWRESLWTNV
jgi:hypothetical protein